VPITKQTRFILGVEDVEVFCEPKMLLPKPLERKCKSKLVWTELTKIWQSDQSLIGSKLKPFQVKFFDALLHSSFF
jgi:hypothetical protein